MTAVEAARAAAGAHFLLAQGVDGRVVVRGRHQAWVSAAMDPRDFLVEGQRGVFARGFAEELTRIADAMVLAALGRAA